jgi:serine/threonine-protein kinase HipA
MKSKARAHAKVYVRDLYAGELARTTHGARFTYDPAYLAQHAGNARAAVAYTLPMRVEPHEVFGVNLHPYFAGLLPEGLRLRALVRAIKTSEDDLFSLLLAAGPETIGAVHVASEALELEPHVPVADIRKLQQVRFAELLEASLRYGGKSATQASFAGVQPKVSAGMISFPVRASSGRKAYILKLNPEHPQLVQNEAFFMTVAKKAGIPVANVKLVHDAHGESGLLVERFDRVASKGSSSPYELAQEDV